MHIYVDADACPVIRIVENIARKYNIETTLICDTNHVLTSDYSDVVTVSTGADAVDAAMALSKGAYAIHQSGKWYTNDNIDQMLMQRHITKCAKRASSKNHIKGHKKRSNEDNIHFAESFEKLVLYDKDSKRPVIKASICTGEQVAGFKDIHTGKIEEVMLIRSEADLDNFKKMYGINEKIEKEY